VSRYAAPVLQSSLSLAAGLECHVEIAVRTDPAGPVVAVIGNLDLNSAPAFKERVAEIIASGLTDLVLDMGDVPFVDSAGLVGLLSALKTTRLAGGSLRIAAPSDHLRTLLTLSSLDRVLPPYDSVERAVSGG
jgi:anti-sigma B factor antagonist